MFMSNYRKVKSSIDILGVVILLIGFIIALPLQDSDYLYHNTMFVILIILMLYCRITFLFKGIKRCSIKKMNNLLMQT